MFRYFFTIGLIITLPLSFSGCLLAVGAVGAEAGYVASQEDRSTGQTIDDQLILTSIKSKLLADSEVSGLNINVDVHKGNVTLRGYTHSANEIDRAIEIARATKGVASVESKMVLE